MWVCSVKCSTRDHLWYVRMQVGQSVSADGSKAYPLRPLQTARGAPLAGGLAPQSPIQTPILRHYWCQTTCLEPSAALPLAWHSQCSRHFARDSQIAVMQLCRTVLTAQVYCANKWSWSCLQHCGPQHQMQRTMHEHQTCMRGQMMAAGCKQAPRMGSTCG